MKCNGKATLYARMLGWLIQKISLDVAFLLPPQYPGSKRTELGTAAWSLGTRWENADSRISQSPPSLACGCLYSPEHNGSVQWMALCGIACSSSSLPPPPAAPRTPPRWGWWAGWSCSRARGTAGRNLPRIFIFYSLQLFQVQTKLCNCSIKL